MYNNRPWHLSSTVTNTHSFPQEYLLLSFLLCLLSVSAQSLIPSLKKLEYMQHKWGTSEDHAAYFQLLKKKKKNLKKESVS